MNSRLVYKTENRLRSDYATKKVNEKKNARKIVENFKIMNFHSVQATHDNELSICFKFTSFGTYFFYAKAGKRNANKVVTTL